METSSIGLKGSAATVKSTFNRETAVSIDIKANAAIVWALLTNSIDYPQWNSTIISIDGKIKAGEKIKLKSTLDPKRTFTLLVKEYLAEKRLVWGDGKCNRIYSITDNKDGTITFSMTEKIGGLMFPLYAKYIPSFDKSFEQFAADLKKESENKMNTK